MRRMFYADFVFACLVLAVGTVGGQEPQRKSKQELSVHLVQANNDSAYAFVRAKFEPGEVRNPWAVRFFNQSGTEVPYFVWDSITWKVAREGRTDWGHQYALLNHHSGSSQGALEIRSRRLEAAKQQLPELGAVLAAQDEAAKQAGESVCAALYLVRHRVPAFAKDKLKLRIYSTPQAEPNQTRRTGQRANEKLRSAAGELVLENLPDSPVVRWKGQELLRDAGFELGDKSGEKDGSIKGRTHADATRPFLVEIAEGMITKVSVLGKTNGRGGSDMDWQCTYWLFPEGSYVALNGFSFSNTQAYLGGGLSMGIWEMPREPRTVHEPLWEKPWWLHQLGDSAFAAIHQFGDVPLALGYGNNPFNVSTPSSFQVASGEKTKGLGDGILALKWTYELTDARIYRLFHPLLDNNGSFNLADVTDLREALLGNGRLTKVPKDATGKDGRLIWPPERIAALENALRFVKWRPGEDWLYRQYVVGLGLNANEAEGGVREIVGAACGWVDRPFDEEEIAELLVQFSLRQSSQLAATSHRQAWTVLPSALHARDRVRAEMILKECADPIEMATDAMEMIRKQIAAGGSPIQGATKGGGEGWHNNPAYFAVSVPDALRFMEHFQLNELAPHRQPEYRKALLQWADFSLETLGGKPFHIHNLQTSLRALWPNRVVMLVPLMLRAYGESNEERYLRVAQFIFDDLIMSQVEKNPQGYFWAWGPSAKKAELFDPNYNMAVYDRGLVDFWSENQLTAIDKERSGRYAAAQARYLVFSGQFLDTLETDNMTAVQSHFPGGIPSALGQLSLFLYDDFAFYRGLLGDPIRWGVIDDGATVEGREGRRNFYAQKTGSRGAVFWAYGIGRVTPPSKTARQMLAHWRAEQRKK